MSIPGRRALASAAATAVVTAGLVATGGAASAADLRVSDPAGDPVTITFDSTDGEETSTPAPGARAVDVTTVRFDYRARFLVAVGRAGAARKATQAYVRVKGGGRDEYFRSTRTGGVRIDGGPACEGGVSSFDGEAGTYRLRIPNSCFGAPDRARLGFALLRGDEDAATIDVAGRTGFSYESGSGIKLSEAVARG